jgi:hypothetical protein
MSTLDRLTRLGLDIAARRWPRDIAEDLRYEWGAELAAIRHDPHAGRFARAGRAMAFAGSLALSPAVEPDGAEPAGWRDRLLPPAAAAGLLLVAAAAFDAVHAAGHRSGVASMVALAAAAATMAALGHRFRGGAVAMTISMGVTMFAFLMAGNRVAVMPFMGWRDVLPAVSVWTVATAVAVALARRRRVLGAVAAVLALEAASVAGSLHAAHVLQIGLRTAPGWLPLALVPASGTSGASRVLLGNTSVMAGPMLLCSLFVLAMAVRRAPFPATAQRPDLRIPMGVAATAAVLIVAELARRSEPAWSRVIENSAVFGFGFLAETPGRIAVALIGGLVAGHLGAAPRESRVR